MQQPVIYHFLLDNRVGGPHVYVLSLKEAIGDDFTFQVVTSGKSPVADSAIVNLRTFSSLLYPLEVIINVMLIVLLSARGRVKLRNSVFDVHGAAHLAPLIAAWILRKPLVWHFHETVDAFTLFVRAGQLILKSLPHELIAVATKCVDAFSLRNAVILEAPINLGYWQRVDRDDAELNGSKPLTIVCVANFNPLKGQDVLLKALLGFDKKCVLYLIGRKLETQKAYADLVDRLAAQIESTNPHVTLRFLGWQSREQIRRLLENSDVFVLPSRSEAHPIALVEAMAMELVVVGTDVGGVSKIIPNSGIGFLVQKENPTHIQQALCSISEMSEVERYTMGRVAREHIKQHFSPVDIAQKHVAIYRSLLTPERR